MDTRASHIAVGAFVMLLVLGGFGLIVWWIEFSAPVLMASHYARFLESVQGLNTGSPVLFGGIPVGHVTAVGIDPVDSAFARIDIAVSAKAPIRSNSVATLELQGFTGGVLVEITRGTPEGTLIKDGAEIPSRYTPIQRMIAGMPGMIAKGNELLDNIGTIISPENIAAARRILASVQKFRALAMANSDQIGKTLGSLAEAGKQISKTNAEFRDLGAAMGAFTDKLGAQVAAASREGHTLASNLKTLADSYNKMYDENRASIDTFTTTGLYELPAMIVEVDLAYRTIKRIAREIADNPAQYFLQDRQSGFQAPGPGPTKPRH